MSGIGPGAFEFVPRTDGSLNDPLFARVVNNGQTYGVLVVSPTGTVILRL